MTRDTLILGLRFLTLLLIQVFVLNHINLFGYLNPMLYLLFVVLYPLQKERANFIGISFLLGLCVDFFSNSGGIHAAATVAIAYFRLPILQLIINRPDLDYAQFRINQEPILKVLLYLSILTFIHHTIIFSLEYFSWGAIITVFKNSFETSIFTILLSTLYLFFFRKNSKSNF